MQKRHQKLIGKKFNRLTLLDYVISNTKSKNLYARFACECGKIKTILLSSVTSERTQSCGCFREEQARAAAHNRNDKSTWAVEYEKGASIKEIAKRSNCATKTVSNYLTALNIEIRNASDTQRVKNGTTINDEIFDIVNAKSAYWLGFICSDGNVRGNTVSFVQKQEKTVKDFRTFIQSSRKIHPINNNSAFTFSCESPYMVQVLKEYGICERKSLLLGKLDSRLVESRDFWRGVCDGDGYVKNTPKYRLDICGTKPLMEQWLDFLKNNGSVTKAKIHPMRSIFRVQLSAGTADHAIRLLYENAWYSVKV